MKNNQGVSSHGGARPGAGRRAGVPNKRTAELQAEVEASGITPLDFMLKIMRDENADEAKRIDCAKAAAPYVHAKLSSVDATVDLEGALNIIINKPGA